MTTTTTITKAHNFYQNHSIQPVRLQSRTHNNAVYRHNIEHIIIIIFWCLHCSMTNKIQSTFTFFLFDSMYLPKLFSPGNFSIPVINVLDRVWSTKLTNNNDITTRARWKNSRGEKNILAQGNLRDEYIAINHISWRMNHTISRL